MVKEALQERATLMTNSPHLTHALPIVVPLYSWLELPWNYVCLKLYAGLTWWSNAALEPAKYLSSVEVRSLTTPLMPTPNPQHRGLCVVLQHKKNHWACIHHPILAPTHSMWPLPAGFQFTTQRHQA